MVDKEVNTARHFLIPDTFLAAFLLTFYKSVAIVH